MKRQELLTALEKVKPGLANKEFIEQATSFVFMNGRVVTYNDEISVQYPVPDLNITGSIQAKELYTFLNKIKDEEVDVQQTEIELVFTAGKASAGFALNNEIKLPVLQLEQDPKWLDLPDDFLEAMRFVLFNCAGSSINPIFNCVHIRTDGYVESCDNNRLTVYKTALKKLKTSLLIPANSVRLLLQHKVVKMNLQNSWVHFTDGQLIFSCRLYEDKYPSTGQILQMEDAKPIVLPQSLVAVLERAVVFSSTDITPQVCVQAKHARLTISTRNNTAWFKEWVKIDSPTEFVMYVNPEFLLDIIKNTSTAELSGFKLKFTTDKWVHVAALIHI